MHVVIQYLTTLLSLKILELFCNKTEKILIIFQIPSVLFIAVAKTDLNMASEVVKLSSFPI